MRSLVRSLVKVVSETLDLQEPIYEMGSFQVGGEERIADPDLRPFFKGKMYVGCDIRDGVGVDRIEDIENLSIPDGTVGTVLVMETLEHVKNPLKALDEVKRVLRDDGVLIMSSAMNFPVHEIPHDYWRFTPAGFDLLLDGLPTRIIGTIGEATNPHTVFAIGFKQPSKQTDYLLEEIRCKLSAEFGKVKQRERSAAKAVRRLGRLLRLIPPLARALEFALARGTHFDFAIETVTHEPVAPR